MLGVASASSSDRTSGDPLANLERLIKENSEVQAGNFQLQHEMRSALSDRNVMLRELCEAVNKEKELVEILADRCKKTEQQKDLTEWISQTLKQVIIDRAESKSTFAQAESNVERYIDSVRDSLESLRNTNLEATALQSQQSSLSANIRAEQSSLAKALVTLDGSQANLEQSKSKLCEILDAAEMRSNDVIVLQQSVSDAFTEAFNRQINSRSQIEEFEQEIATLEQVKLQMDSRQDQISDLKRRISEFQLLIQSNQSAESTLESTKLLFDDFCKTLESWNTALLSDLASDQASKQRLIELSVELDSLEKKCGSLQNDIFCLRESEKDSVHSSMRYGDKIMETLQALAEEECDLQNKRNILIQVSAQKQKLLHQKSEALTEFTGAIRFPLGDQLENVRRLNKFNEQCRDIMQSSQYPVWWDSLRRDLTEISNACSALDEHDITETEVADERTAVSKMWSECSILSEEIEKLDIELVEAFARHQQLNGEHYEKMEELKVRIRDKSELRMQLTECKKEAEENKIKFSAMLSEKAASYQQRMCEDQPSDMCDFSSIPKEILDDMNNRKQQQARKYNERLSKLQAQIDAASREVESTDALSGAGLENLDRPTGRTKKLMARRVNMDPWMLE